MNIKDIIKKNLYYILVAIGSGTHMPPDEVVFVPGSPEDIRQRLEGDGHAQQSGPPHIAWRVHGQVVQVRCAMQSH